MRYRMKQQFLLKDIDGDSIIMARGRGAINFNGVIVLNEAGALLSSQCVDNYVSIDQLAECLVHEYSIEKERAILDVTQYINKMSEHGLLDTIE